MISWHEPLSPNAGCLKLTSMRCAIVPPPMATYEIALPFPALDVEISRQGCFVVVLYATLVEVHGWDPVGSMPSENGRRGKSTFPLALSDNLPQQVSLLDDRYVFVLFQGSLGSTIASFLLDDSGLVQMGPEVSVKAAILRMFIPVEHDVLCVEDFSGLVREFWRPDKRDSQAICRFPDSTPRVQACRIHGRVSSSVDGQ